MPYWGRLLKYRAHHISLNLTAGRPNKMTPGSEQLLHENMAFALLSQ